MAAFRKSRPGAPRVTGQFQDAGPTEASPFSQNQILHLMKTEFARARRYGFAVSCMLVQVDRLQGLIDLHGEALRSAVRQALAHLVQDKTRGADHLGLASENRYLLVLPHTDGAAARMVGERLRDAFAGLDIEVGGQALALQLSVGVAACDAKDTLFFDTLLSQAEAALAEAAGCGEVVLFRRDGAGGNTDPEPEAAS